MMTITELLESCKKKTSMLKTIIPWTLVTSLSIVCLLLWMQSEKRDAVQKCEAKTEEAEEKFEELGDLLMECAESLEYREAICEDGAAAAFERANLIFQCEIDLCANNGWTPPENFFEPGL